MNPWFVIEVVKEVRPRRSLKFTIEETTMKSEPILLRAAHWQIARRERGGRGHWSKRATVVGAVVCATLGTGIAVAAWSSSGVGASSAKAGVALGVTAGTATPSGTLLYPTGAASAPLAVTITNPNPYPVKVTNVTLAAQSAPATVVTPNNASCTTATALVSTSAVNVSNANLLSIPANSTATYTTPTNVVTMGLASDDGCQNATFTFANATVTASSG
jgi:hypothetical protein